MEKFNYEGIKANLKAMRAKRRMTQADVARALGVSIQTMRSYENSPEKLDLHKLIALAEIYDCPPRVFFMD